MWPREPAFGDASKLDDLASELSLSSSPPIDGQLVLQQTLPLSDQPSMYKSAYISV